MNLAHPESLLSWNTLILLILLFLLGKYVWRPIMGAVKQREESTNKALESAEEARAQMTNLKTDNERLLVEAYAGRGAMLKETREIKDKIVAEAKEETGRGSEKLVKQAKQAIESEKKVALAQLEDQAVSLSIRMAQKAMKNGLSDEKRQTALINDYLESVTLD